jgi:hypothetical protein
MSHESMGIVGPAPESRREPIQKTLRLRGKLEDR